MERRRFLRNLTFASTAAILPLKFIDIVLEDGSHAEMVKPGANIAPVGDFEIEYSTKTIKYIGDSEDGGIRLEDLYNFLKDEWDTEQGEMPIERESPYAYTIKELNLTSKHYKTHSYFSNVNVIT